MDPTPVENQASSAQRQPQTGGAQAARVSHAPLTDEVLLEESSKLLEAFKIMEGRRHSVVSQVLSYAEYLKKVLSDPRYMIRNVFQYTADAMESFGFTKKTVLGQEILDFNLRQWPWESRLVVDKKKLEGQELALYEYYQQMKLFGRREYSNRMFVFHGPPGSGKTRLNDTLDAMLEDYSEHNEQGGLWRIAFVFPEEAGMKPYGFAANQARSASVSEEDTPQGRQLIYRPLGNTDPLFLLSTSCDGEGPREKLLQKLEQHERLPPDLNKDYLLRGELDTFSEAILETLMSYYRNEHLSQSGSQGRVPDARVLEEVLRKHVRVERYTLSRRQGRGLCSKWATPNRDADIEPFYNSYSPPPEEIRAAERDLYMPTSFMVRANRGHLHFSDLFRPDERDRGRDDISHLNHLLNEIESGHTQIVSLRQAASLKTEKVNVQLRADANDELISLKTHAQGWDSLGRRLQFITVPHVVRYLSEASAHKDFFRTILGADRVICPHVLNTVALFSTSTRLLKPDPVRYKAVHEQLPKILGRMSVVEKALLLQEPRDGVKSELNMLKSDEKLRWHQDELSVLAKFLPNIANEYMGGVGETKFSLYDGGFGISTANAQDLLRKVAVFRPTEPITVLEVLEVLKQQGDKFPYYEKIEEAKRQLAHARLEERKEEGLRKGKQMSERDVQESLREIADVVERQFPIPAPQAIIKEVETYAKKRIQDDFYYALGIASEERSSLSIQRYLAHARVAIGQPPLEVEPQHRVTEQERKHNDKLLEDFEDRVVKGEDLSSKERRMAFRKHLFEQIGFWQAEHPNESAAANYESIFGELVEGLRVVRKESLERPLSEFERLTREYAEDPLKITRDMAGKEDERRRASRWAKAIRVLEDTLKYPREERWDTIRKHLEWAIHG